MSHQPRPNDLNHSVRVIYIPKPFSANRNIFHENRNDYLRLLNWSFLSVWAHSYIMSREVDNFVLVSSIYHAFLSGPYNYIIFERPLKENIEKTRNSNGTQEIT